jgi:hypothetical protein
MNLKHLKAAELLTKTQSLVAEERKVTLELIEHLAEIYRRQLFSDLAYPSLWEFCVRHLGMSEGAAQRRISAMKLMLDSPEAKTALETGALSLSNAAKVQSFRQAQKKLNQPVTSTPELIQAVSNLTQKQCEQKLFEISPQALPKEQTRIVSESGAREVKFTLTPEDYQKLERLKDLLSHSKPTATNGEIIAYAIEQALALTEKRKRIPSLAETRAGSAARGEFKAATASPRAPATALIVPFATFAAALAATAAAAVLGKPGDQARTRSHGTKPAAVAMEFSPRP